MGAILESLDWLALWWMGPAGDRLDRYLRASELLSSTGNLTGGLGAERVCIEVIDSQTAVRFFSPSPWLPTVPVPY